MTNALVYKISHWEHKPIYLQKKHNFSFFDVNKRLFYIPTYKYTSIKKGHT